MDGIEQELCNARLFDVDEVRLEQTLRRLEPLATHSDHAAVRQSVAFHKNSGVFAEPLVELQVVGDVAELLLDLSDGFEVGGSVESVTATEEEGDEVAGDVPAGDVESASEVVEDGGFVDGDNVRDAVSGVDDYAGAETCAGPTDLVIPF